MGLNLRKFWVLTWKTLIVKGRHYIETFLDLIVPTFLFMILAVLRYQGGDFLKPTNQPDEIFDTNQFLKKICDVRSDYNATFYYAPAGGAVDDLMNKVIQANEYFEYGGCSYSQNFTILNIKGVEDEAAIERAYEIYSNQNTPDDEVKENFLGGVVFEDLKYDDDSGTKLSNLKYKLRLNPEDVWSQTQYMFFPVQVPGPRTGFAGTGELIGYLRAEDLYGTFAMLQALIDLAYIELSGDNLNLLPSPDVAVDSLEMMTAFEQMPYPAYIESLATVIIGLLIPLFAVLSFAFVIPPILKRIVQEKQTGVKELMKMMGLPSWMNWVFYFFDAIMTLIISIAIMTLIITVEWKSGEGSIIEFSDGSIVYFFFLIYSMALVVFLFTISTIFSNPNLALTAGILIHIVGWLVVYGLVTDEKYGEMSGATKVILAIIYPNIGLQWGIKVMSFHENAGTGSQWNNLFERAVDDDPITMGVVWIIFLVNMILFGIITWYIDSVHPGPYGVAKKWYFCFQPSYWAPSLMKSNKIHNQPIMSTKNQNESYFEPDSSVGVAGMDVKNLNKVFKSLTGDPVQAVNSVSFKAYEGQITALLGHNGAGKSTTMNVLTGMLSATGGSAMINGFNIENQMSSIRQSLGLCPQHNMLFSDLTVEEHLIFFAMLKGFTMSQARRGALEMITKLDLTPKKRSKADTLSGGMKRKLHLGIALIGNSKVVMLDEPTSGMDPEARRHMWDLLIELKKDKTILLTTHFMEEADVLGDRVVIMAHGKAQCNGSPMFLKRLLGDGYTLSMIKGPKCDVSAVSKLVKEEIEGVSLKNTKNELIYNLPINEAANFPQLLEKLDGTLHELDVGNIGIKVATMEDVFLKIGDLDEEEDPNESQENGNPKKLVRRLTTINDAETNNFEGSKTSLNGLRLYWQQFYGLIVKRFIYTKRRYLLYGILALMPALQCIIQQATTNNAGNGQVAFPPLEMDKNMYGNARYYYHNMSNTNEVVFSDSYAKIVGDLGRSVSADNYSSFILEEAKKDTFLYRKEMVAGADFPFIDDTLIPKAMYNAVPLHALPLSVNLLDNALLKHYANPSNSEASITVINHPLPRGSPVKFDDVINNVFVDPDAFRYCISLTIGICLFVSVFLIFPLIERITNAKQVQIMTGVHPGIFWLANLTWDIGILLLSASLAIIILVAMDSSSTFSTHGAGGTLFLIFVLYGLSAIPFSYLISFVAKTQATGFTISILVNILSGCIAPIAVWVLRKIGDEEDASPGLGIASDVVRYIFSFIPSYSLSYSILGLVNTQTSNNVCINNVDPTTLTNLCTSFAGPQPGWDFNGLTYLTCCSEEFVPANIAVCENVFVNAFCKAWPTTNDANCDCHEPKSPFSFTDRLNGINEGLLFLFGTCILYMGLLVLIEFGIIRKIRAIFEMSRVDPGNVSRKNNKLDEDVSEEKVRVKSLMNQPQQKSDVLLVSDLFKQFGLFNPCGNPFTAVDGLSFGVKHGECFGLLGVNGAGKTTSFRMLTGDEIMSNGKAISLGVRLEENRRQFLSQIGYCPQFDSIIGDMTGREMLRLFARLRGMDPSEIEGEVSHWISEVGIEEYADRKCGTYSGGNKRKLNVAQALVADPPIVFLDEPSSGVDPASRRKLWKIIRSVQRNGQAVILTSHSMEECDELCARLGIMVNGQFQCLGPTRYLKQKFGQGFTILVKLNTQGQTLDESFSTMEFFKKHIINKFDGCLVKDEHKDYVHFHVTNPKTPWAYLFSTMESAKNQFPAVSDYSVSETTLEQVFLSFAKEQRKILK